MIKRKFGMHHLNVTQGRYNSYSHSGINAYDLAGSDSGIDFFIAHATYECVGMLMYEDSGFANTILLYDPGNDVTLSFSHDLDNDEGHHIGRIWNEGERVYEEGTQPAKGAVKPSGNHIHIELSKGLCRTKIKKNGQWQLPEPINIEDYFFLDETITVINDGGYQWEYRKGKGEDTVINDGYSKIEWLGKTIHVYKGYDGMKLGLMSAKGNEKSRQLIYEIDDDRVHYCKLNGGYFDMGTGQHYGVEVSPTLRLLTRQDVYQVVWMGKDGYLNYCKDTEFTNAWYGMIHECEFAITPYAILYHKTDVKEVSKAYTNKLGYFNTQSFLVQLKDKTVILCAAQDQITPEMCVTFAKEMWGDELYHVSIYDSGGSTQMVANGKRVFCTGRAIANVLTLFKYKDEDKVQSVEETITDIEEIDWVARCELLEAKLDKVVALCKEINELLETEGE